MFESVAKPNIYQLSLSTAPARPPHSELRAEYSDFKDTYFWSDRRRKWNYSLDDDQYVHSSQQLLSENMIDIVVQAQIDPRRAERQYQKLHKSGHWHAQDEFWYEARELEHAYYAFAQLMDVLYLSMNDFDAAEKRFQALVASPMWQADVGIWRDAIGPDWASRRHNATDQLLGVVVQHLFDPALAEALYRRLKAGSDFIDAEGLWNNRLEFGSPTYTARAQLFGVLAQSLFDPPAALDFYRFAQQSLLWDPESAQWLSQYYGHSPSGVRFSGDQLLDIYVRSRLNAVLSRSETEHLEHPSIPKLLAV